MLNHLLKFSLCIALLSLFALQSCEKESTVDVENFTDESIGELQDRAGCGKHGCFEFVFPISIQFPDSTIAEAEDYEQLHEIISTWKEDNPESETKPGFVFPVDIVGLGGEIHTLESQEDLRSARQRCRKFFEGHGPRGKRGKGYSCFDLVFPLSIAFPDGTEVEAATKPDLKDILREWKQTHSLQDGRPELVFPLQVQLDDGTLSTIDNAGVLDALKESCRN